MLLLGVGLGEDQRHLGEVAERDPHLLAADRPAARRSSSRGCAGWRRRSRCRARSGRSSRAPRPSRAAAATAASAPRCPSARSSRRPARSAPRRRCGRRSRRGRPARRSGRSRGSRGRGRRTLRRPARRGSRPRRACCASSRSKRAARSFSLDPRRDLLVGEFARRLGDQPLLVAQLEVHLTPARLGSVELAALVRGSRRRPPGPRGCAGRARSGSSAPSIAATAWISRVVEARKASSAARRSSTGQRALLDVERLDQAVAGDRLEHAGVERRGAQRALAARPRRSSRSAARARCRRAGPAPPRRRRAPWRAGSPACWRRRRAT